MASLRQRDKCYCASYYEDDKKHRKSLDTTSYHFAKVRLRNLEGALAQDPLDNLHPPTTQIVGKYAAHIKNTKSKNGIKVDLWYLQRIFGPVCPLLTVNTKRGFSGKRERLALKYAEDIRTSDISSFIAERVQKTASVPKPQKSEPISRVTIAIIQLVVLPENPSGHGAIDERYLMLGECPS